MKFQEGSANTAPGRINLGKSLAKAGVTKPIEPQSAAVEEDALRVSLGNDAASSRPAARAPESRTTVSKTVAQGVYARQFQESAARDAVAAPPPREAITARVTASAPAEASVTEGPVLLDDGTEAPTGPSAEIFDLARQYVTLHEQQTGQSYTDPVREQKIREVASFYGAPSRAGRLQDLVTAFVS